MIVTTLLGNSKGSVELCNQNTLIEVKYLFLFSYADSRNSLPQD